MVLPLETCYFVREKGIAWTRHQPNQYSHGKKINIMISFFYVAQYDSQTKYEYKILFSYISFSCKNGFKSLISSKYMDARFEDTRKNQEI